MHLQPYSIYVDKRPLKIAYLLNPSNSKLSGFDAIVEYNHSKWGGRFNPIILTDGRTISDKWWELLNEYDPDVVKSLVFLEDDVVEKIHNFLSPISLEVPTQIEDDYRILSIRNNDEGISNYPSLDKIATLSRSFMRNRLVLFELENEQDDSIKHFIYRNFGKISHTVSMDRALEGVEKKVVRITDKQSLITALTEISSNEKYIYQSQICSIPNHISDVEHARAVNGFLVVVGDTTDDLAYFWNSILSNPQWKRTDLNQLWLPEVLAKDKDIQAVLKHWIIKAADPYGTTTAEVIFTSSSMKAEELNDVVNALTDDKRINKTILSFKEPQIPCFRTLLLTNAIKANSDLYRATGVKEQLTLREPVEGSENECWVATVYIQFWTERYQNYVGKDLWWKLPKRNSLAHFIFGGYSRISGNGFPTVIKRKGQPALDVKLPDDDVIFRMLITGNNFSHCYAKDPRGKFAKSPFCSAQRSDKGRYLSGLIDLFTELTSAFQVFQEHYWRTMFEKLTFKDDTKYYRKKEDIHGKIRSKLEKFKLHEGNIDWWTNFLFKMANELAWSGTEIPYKAFKKEAEKELGECPLSQENEQDLKDTMNYLMELNILLGGVKSHCPSCGYANWYHIDEASQNLKCNGCGHYYSLGPEVTWYYKLNSLVQTGIKQGLVPVLLVLGQMFQDCTDSFMYTTSLEVFVSDKEDPDYEIDLICISDGKLIVGEVKQSSNSFKNHDFERMATIAEKLRPDVIIFASSDVLTNANVKSNLQALHEILLPLRIEVKWYQLHTHILKPSISL